MAPENKLSPHFTLAEAIRSDTAKRLGVDNYPDSDEDLATLGRTAMKMELVRTILGSAPITVSSWYRNSRVNQAVGGVNNSQHKLGEAVDFSAAKFGSHKDIVKQLIAHKETILYDQLILEPNWVHISFCTSRANRLRAPRLQFLDTSGS